MSTCKIYLFFVRIITVSDYSMDNLQVNYKVISIAKLLSLSFFYLSTSIFTTLTTFIFELRTYMLSFPRPSSNCKYHTMIWIGISQYT